MTVRRGRCAPRATGVLYKGCCRKYIGAIAGDCMQKELPARKHPRLKGYDYNNNGTHFITFCTGYRRAILGEIVGRDALGAPCAVELSEYGKIIHKEIEDTPSYYKNIFIDKFIVMPNHVHMIILIDGYDGAPRGRRALQLQ